MNEHPYQPIPYRVPRPTPVAMHERAEAFLRWCVQRRSVRDFAAELVPRSLIEMAIATASTAPSGANRQPWRFVAISQPHLKRQIRLAAEAEERESYEGGRMPAEWLAALAPLGTTWEKPYLETAPWLVVVFEQTYGLEEGVGPSKNYYVRESVGIACGFFIAALHNMGLATLTHTPSPMGFLSKILDRPPNEKPFALFPVGYPAPGALVPDIQRKALEDVAVWFDGMNGVPRDHEYKTSSAE
jgi:nitroreductase